MGTAELQKDYDVAIRYRVFPLHPEIPEEGLDLEDLFRGRGLDLPQMLAHLRRVAADLGLPIGDRSRTCNSRKAQELMKWAELQGRGDPFREAAYAAYFVHGKNLAGEDVLADVAEAAGLPAPEVREVLRGRVQAAAVDADWALARTLGVTAVPTLVAGGQSLMGYQKYEALGSFAAAAGAAKRR